MVNFGLSLSLDPEFDNSPIDWLLLRYTYASTDDHNYTDIYGKPIQGTKYFYDPIYYRGTTLKANVSYDNLCTFALTAGVDMTTSKRNNEYYNLKISNNYFQPEVPEFRAYNDIWFYSSYFL